MCFSSKSVAVICGRSVNVICDAQDTVHYPTEFLNSFDVKGLPLHNLALKEGVPVILLRPPKLCNGSQMDGG